MTDQPSGSTDNVPVEQPKSAAAPFYTRRPKFRRLPSNTPELEDYVAEWIAERQSAIGQLVVHGARAPEGRLWWLADDPLRRWHVLDVGNGRTAWMERAITSAATLMDFRTRNLSRRLRDREDPAAAFCLLDEEEQSSPAQRQQVRTALTFASEWERYLVQLMIAPWPATTPEDRLPLNLLTAKLAHCRPVGAFFTHFLDDEWTEAGGREVCRKPLICPHCHARQTTRLVQRVEAGPWAETRRKGKHLVMFRIKIPTSSLDLDLDRLRQEQEPHASWIEAEPEYSSDCPEEAMINRIGSDQDLAQTLTRCEMDAAASILTNLVQSAKDLGMEGGLRIHQVGPRMTEAGRRFLHELSVVGEIPSRDLACLSEYMGVDDDDKRNVPQIAGQTIECVTVRGNCPDAARVLLAGTACDFSLKKIGARHNAAVKPKGLRGTMAWPPLFLFSASSWWSRYIVLARRRHQTYRSFGSWKDRLPADRDFRSPVEEHRWRAEGGPLREGWARDPIHRLNYFLREKDISRAALARAAGVSKAAVTRLLRDRHGSQQLIEKLQKALRDLAPPKNSDEASLCKFESAQEVKDWMEFWGRSISWLAREIGWSRSKVSRILSGRSQWNPDLGCLATDVAHEIQR